MYHFVLFLFSLTSAVGGGNVCVPGGVRSCCGEGCSPVNADVDLDCFVLQMCTLFPAHSVCAHYMSHLAETIKRGGAELA